MNISLRQLLTLDAIVKNGSCKAAADSLYRTHASVLAAIKKMEEELGFDVLDRSGYRVVLSERGAVFFKASQPLLEEYKMLDNKVKVLKSGSDLQLSIVFGDVTPPELLKNDLKKFNKLYPNVQLNLFSENIMGPRERLFDNSADIMIHHVDQYDAKLDSILLDKVNIIPVVSQDFLRFNVHEDVTYDDMKNYPQCIISCTAVHSHTRNYFVVDASPKVVVDTQLSKKSIIVSGIGWGHMPEYMVKSELESGELISIAGKNIKMSTLNIVAARRIDISYESSEQVFWNLLKEKKSDASPSSR